MTEQIDFPFILRGIRNKKNFTQEQLAEKLRVSFATVNRWEGGKLPKKVDQEKIARLAEEVGINLSETTPPSMLAEPSTKNMEQMLWDAACSIRGQKDAAKFKDYLLPLLFLKRLSDVFDDEIDRLAESYGDKKTALEIAEGDHSLLRFYIPPEARWGVINGRESYEWAGDEKPKDIGAHLTKAVRAVVKFNPTLSGVIDIVEFAAERNGERDINPAKLRSVVETFSDPRYRLGLADVQPDFLGRAYEYLLRKFAEGSGQSAGEYFTPTEVGMLIAHIMRPKPGEECHDYACGSAGLLVKLQIVARELNPASTKIPLKLYGQELQAESFAIAKMNGIIHDMEIEIARGDTMINPKFKTGEGKMKTFDIVVANPMWNQPFSPDIFKNDSFDRFAHSGGVTTGRGDWAWLQHTLAAMNNHGRAAVVLDTNAVTRGSGSKGDDKERNIRKWFVDHDLIEGVILLPDNLFYNTPAAGIIIVLNKKKPTSRKDRIIILNASKKVKKGKPKNYIPENAIRPLASAFLKGEDVEGEVAVITREEALEADYNLDPENWLRSKASGNRHDLSELISDYTSLSNSEVEPTFQKLLSSFSELTTTLDSEEWAKVKVEDAVIPLRFERQKQLQTSEFLKDGKWPIIDQGKEEIAGYTNDINRIIKSEAPVIIFGDHTRIVKYTDKEFALGADGTKPLLAKPEFLPKYLYYALCNLDIPSRGYNRHYKLLAEESIPKPETSEQEEIIKILEIIDQQLELQRDKLEKIMSMRDTIRHKLFAHEVDLLRIEESIETGGAL